MDFGRTQITGLLNSTAHEKTKYLALLHKLKALLGLNKGHKLILTSIDKLLLTEAPSDIYNNINYKHPIVLVLSEYLEKASSMPGGSKYFVEVAKALIDEVSYLLDNGVRPKTISDTLKDMSELDIKFGVDGMCSADSCTSKCGDKCSTTPSAASNATPNATIITNEINGEDSSSSEPACNEPTNHIENNLQTPFVTDDVERLVKATLKDSHLAELLIECIETTRSYDTEKVRIHKMPVGSLDESYRVEGMIFNRKPEGSIAKLTETSIGIFNCPLDINRTELKGTVLFKTHEDLMNFTRDEVAGVKNTMDAINVNAMVVCGKVDPLFLEFANRRNILVLKVFSKFDLKRVCDAVDGSISNTLGPIIQKGRVREIATFSDGGFDFTRLAGGKAVNTLVLKNSVREVLESKERTILALLEGLRNSKRETLALPDFHGLVANKMAGDGAVREAVCHAVSGLPATLMFNDECLRCLRYAFNFIGVLMEVDDYLIAKKDVLDIKPPKHDGHWDEDH